MTIDVLELLNPEEVQTRIKKYLEDHPELIATAIKKAVDQQIRVSIGQAFDTWQNKTAKENLALVDAAVQTAFKTALEEIKPDMAPIKAAINKQIKQILKNISLEIVSHRGDPDRQGDMYGQTTVSRETGFITGGVRSTVQSHCRRKFQAVCLGTATEQDQE